MGLFRHLVTVALAVIASQITLRYLKDPVQTFQQPAAQDSSAVVGWSQLAFLRSQGQAGCLCCEGGVVHLPDAGRGVQVAQWEPVDPHLTRNVTLPGDGDGDAKVTKQLYQKIKVLGTTAGDGSKKRWWAADNNDGFCVQACAGKG